MKNFALVLLVFLPSGCSSQSTSAIPETRGNTSVSQQESDSLTDESIAIEQAESSTPMSAENALRLVLKARWIGDQEILRLHCLEHPEIELLFNTPFKGAAAERLAELSSKVPIRELRCGDSTNLASGKQLTVTDSMVNKNLKLFVTNQDPEPFSAHLIGGSWKIDPQPLITAKKESD